MKHESISLAVRACPPSLGEFQLATDFDFEAHAKEKKRLKKLAEQIFWASGTIPTFVLLILSDIDLIGAIIGSLALAFPTWALLVMLNAELLCYRAFSLLTGQWKDSKRVEAYLSAKAEWEYFNLTTGIGFWQLLRGLDLEKAVARLFRERGWQVETTAVTGDGGVDLKIGSGASRKWVQCKGYAKPVPVAAVREIAGVCSSCTAKPMLVVVNGVTKPALSEANNLGVTVWDSEQLVQFAKGQH